MYCADCQLIREASHFIYIGKMTHIRSSFSNSAECWRIFHRESVLVSMLLLRIAESLLKENVSISNTRESGPVKNQIAKALLERILEAAKDGKKFKACDRRFFWLSYSTDYNVDLGHRRHSWGARFRRKYQERDCTEDYHGGTIPYHESRWP